MKRDNGHGTVELRRGKWFGRVRLSDGSRPRVPLGKVTGEDEARSKLDALLRRGLETGKLDEMVARLMGPRAVRVRRRKLLPATTVKELAERWTGGKLYEEYGAVAGLRKSLASDPINAWTLAKHAFPVRTRGSSGSTFGDLRVAEVQVDDISAVMASLGGAAESRKHMYSRLKRLFDLAEFPCALRSAHSNPVLRGHRPPRDPDKLYAFLYPTEVLSLLSCTAIPLGRRVLYLLASYFGWRKATLYAFRWSGVDWDHGTVVVTKQKGLRRVDGTDTDEHQGTPIFFVVEPPSVLAVLRAWYEHLGRPADDTAVVAKVGLERNHDEAKVMRDDLQRAGITRSLLFSTASNVVPVRFHDMRATFCTWARRQQRSDLWIGERSGHRPTGKMLDRYTRQAVTLADLRYEPFPDVVAAIPELAEAAVRLREAFGRRPLPEAPDAQ
jgi:integrase